MNSYSVRIPMTIKPSGFTLIELLIVVSIAAILLSLAVPAFDDMQKSNSVRSHQREYLSAFNYAKGEAVSRATVVSICPSDDSASCATADDWSEGWIIFVDNGEGGGTYGDGDRNGSETLLRIYDYQGSNLTRVVDATSTGTELDSISWNHTGALTRSGANTTRVLAMVCDRQEEEKHNRGVSLSLSGRGMLSSDLSGSDNIHDGVYEDENGNASYVALDCSP